MKITISEQYTRPFGLVYHYEMCDGPDGIDEFSGTFNSLGECFEQIVKNRTLNGLSYREATEHEFG